MTATWAPASGGTRSYAFSQSTKIGISVSKLRRHEDPVIAAAARALVTKWKSVVPASRPGVSLRVCCAALHLRPDRVARFALPQTNVGPRTPRSTASDSKVRTAHAAAVFCRGYALDAADA